MQISVDELTLCGGATPNPNSILYRSTYKMSFQSAILIHEIQPAMLIHEIHVLTLSIYEVIYEMLEIK